MIKFVRPFRNGAIVASVLLFASVSGCGIPIAESIDNLTEAVENQKPPIVTVEDGDVTVDPPDVTVIVEQPTSEPNLPTASDLAIPEGAISYINEDTSGLRWTLLGGTWDGSFHPGIVDLLPADWRTVVRTTHLLVVYDIEGDPIVVSPIIVEGGVDGYYTIDPDLVDTTVGYVQTTIRVRNAISGEEVDIVLPAAYR